MRPMQRKNAGHGDLSFLQRLHLQRGPKGFQLSIFGPVPDPFESENQRRELYFEHRQFLHDTALEEIDPNEIPEQYGRRLWAGYCGMTWTRRGFPHAAIQYELKGKAKLTSNEVNAPNTGNDEEKACNDCNKTEKKDVVAAVHREKEIKEAQREVNPEDIADPGGSETATPPPTPAGANVPMPMTTPSPAEASDEAGRRP